MYTYTIINDHIASNFRSHNIVLEIFVQVTGQQNLLSRPFQLALGFSIVPYGANILESENLTLAKWSQKTGPQWKILLLMWCCKIYKQQLWLHKPKCYKGHNDGHFIHIWMYAEHMQYFFRSNLPMFQTSYFHVIFFLW